jgi:hypothetical protein
MRTEDLPLPLVTVSGELALRAAAALRAAGEDTAAAAFERQAMRLWVLRCSDEDGYDSYLGRDQYALARGQAAPFAFGGASAAHIFTDGDRDAFDASALGLDADVAEQARQAVEWGQWELTPTDADISDMHENTDPDRVDEYVALANRAAHMRNTPQGAPTP